MKAIRRFCRLTIWDLLAIISFIGIAIAATRQNSGLLVVASHAALIFAVIMSIGLACGSKRGPRELCIAFALGTLIFYGFEMTKMALVDLISIQVVQQCELFAIQTAKSFAAAGVGLLCSRLAYAVQEE
jgi:hypothetical protein